MYDMMADTNKVRAIQKFREFYFTAKFREKMRRWAWIPRERRICEELSPIRLAEMLGMEDKPIDEESVEIIDKFFGRVQRD
jgi:hypothetical protein